MSYVETTTLKNSTIMLLYSERHEINMNPEYQRMGGVWTLEKRRLLIDSILNDYDLPKIYFHMLPSSEFSRSGYRFSVIDGRQRLEAIWGFMDGHFSLAEDFEYQRDNSIQLGSLSYKDIAERFPRIRVKFDSFVLPVVTVSIEGDDIDLIEDMFSRLNEAVPLNAAEKRNAIGGNAVRAITEISNHNFFVRNVRFRNNRYQHREVAARLLLIEEHMESERKIVDTKKIYLDSFARSYREKNLIMLFEIASRVRAVLDQLSSLFTEGDELLAAQGTIVVYYLLQRSILFGGEQIQVDRRKLLDFRNALSRNRDVAAHNYENASYDLLEYDRMSQQGTNDATSIKERVRILTEFLASQENHSDSNLSGLL